MVGLINVLKFLKFCICFKSISKILLVYQAHDSANVIVEDEPDAFKVNKLSQLKEKILSQQ